MNEMNYFRNSLQPPVILNNDSLFLPRAEQSKCLLTHCFKYDVLTGGLRPDRVC